MDLQDKVVVITGGGSGIGKAMAERFRRAGAAGVVIADLDGDAAEAVARSVGGVSIRVDVAVEADVQRMVGLAEKRFGRIDLMCSNAGVSVRDPDFNNATSASNDTWMLGWNVNVMAHVYAARAALPGMIARGGGYFLHTVSAAGLLSQPGSPVYATTKHAAVGFAESLAITHRSQNIRVSILCPQAVDTPMIRGARGSQAVDGVMAPADVADCVVDGLAAETFLILPHPQVATYMQRKTGDYDRWIAGMVRLRDRIAQPSAG
ncbi:MAG: SDR family oxidoreductase [Phenylobacterium sp.]|uniref:SDR family oxidoreductase n=1 Tax=Phenylobacterium sp. TaxID=1871053 RepID=UPI001A607799|nr:SDR family oxidoreductase [Phenylobacterium sp.]MBL8772048.1 SDR family oxidoreductase [Phenylobacterium sp.]